MSIPVVSEASLSGPSSPSRFFLPGIPQWKGPSFRYIASDGGREAAVASLVPLGLIPNFTDRRARSLSEL